jgi:O-antigen/teichoic acid export membrane protein
LLAGLICARILGKEAFGQMGLLQSTVGFVGLLAGLGLGATATRFVSRYLLSDPDKCGRMLGGILLLGGGTILVGSLGLLLGAGVVADKWLNCPSLEISLRICSIWVFAFAAGELLMAALAGLESFRSVAAMSLLRGCLISGGTIAGLNWGLNGSLIGWSLGLVASAILLFHSLWRECAARGIRISCIKTKQDLDAVLAYAVPTLVSGLSYAPFAWLTNTILVRNPNGFEQMALLSAAYQWRGLFTHLPVSLSRVALPLISSSDSEGRDSADHAFAVSNLLNQLVVWCFGIILLGAAGVLLAFYGTDFLSGRWAFMLVLGGAMVGYVGNSFGSLIQARGLFRMGIIGNLLSGVSLVGCTFLLGRQLGAVSVGIGFMLGYFLNLLFCAVGLVKQGHVDSKLGSRIVITAVAAVFLVLLLAQLPALWAALVAVPLVPLSIWVLYHVFAKPAGISFASLQALTKKFKP